MIKTNHKIKINNRNYYIFNENNRTYVKYEGNFVEIFILQNNINNKKGGGDDAKYAFTYQIRDINNAIEKYEKIFIKRQEKILYLCVNFINKIKSTESSINNKFAKMSISSDYDRSRYLTLINKEFYENLFKKYFIVIMQTINRDSIISEKSELKKIAKYLHFITYDDNEKDKKINNDFKEFEKTGVDDTIDEIVLKENVNNSLNELNNLITTFNADKKKIIDTESLKNNVMAIKNKISKWSAPSWQEILLSTFNEDVEYINDKSEKFKSNQKYLNAILNFLSMESSDINKFDEKSMDKIKKEVEKALETIKNIPNESNNDIDIPELINLIISNIKKLLINFINKNYSKNISSIQKLKDNSKKKIEEIIKSIENYKNLLDTSTTEEIAQVLKTGSDNINENSSGNASSDNSGSGNASSDNSGSGNASSGNASSDNSGPDNSGLGNASSDNSGPGNAETGNAAIDKVDENGGDKVDSSEGKTTITSDIPIYTEDEAEEIRKTRGAYKFWKEKGLDVDISKIKMEISDDKTSITTWLDDPTSFDPKLATLKGNDFYLNGNILKGQELLDYVNNIKKETLKIVTRKGQAEEKYNFDANEIKGIASAPEYASTREQESASAPESPTDNFDASKYTKSELNQRNFAMSLPTKLSDCDKFKKGVNGNKNDGKYNICYAKHKWLESFKKNSTIDCETYPTPSNGLNQSLTESTPGKEQPVCVQIKNTLNRWGTDGTDKKPIREKEEREKKENKEKIIQETKIKYDEEKKEEYRRYNIIESILEGKYLSEEDKEIFEKDFNLPKVNFIGKSNYQNFLVNLKKEFDNTQQPNNLKKEYEKYIAENNNDKFIIDNYDIKSTTSTKNSKGNYLLYAFKLFMHWLIKKNIEIYNKIGSDLIYYYNLSISKYYDDYNMDKDEIRKLTIYHKNPKKINQTIYNLVDHNTVLQNPSLKFYKKQLLFKPDPSNECVTNIKNPTPTCKFNSFLDSYNLKKSTGSVVESGILPYEKMPVNQKPLTTFYVGGNDKKYTNKIYNSQKSKYKVCTYITDVEGNMDYFNKYVKISKILEWTCEKKNRLKFRNDDSIFIYGGDTQDRGDSDIRFVNILLKFKEDYPERVIFIIGNRDANKLRIPSELSEKYSDAQNFLKKYDSYPYWEDKALRVTLRKYLKDNKYDLNVKNRLKYIIERTMGNNDGFEKRRNELSIILKKNISKISDNDVISSFLNSVLPKPKNAIQTNDNYMLKYLMQGQLIYIFGEHIFVHGAINEKNIGKIPKNKNTIEDINVWAKELNNWFHKELKEYMNNPKDGGITKKRKAHNIIDYVVPGDNNDISVVYANNLRNGNGVPINKKVIEQLNKYGIRNIITGHKPYGDCPLIIRDRNLKAISADTSYSNINNLKNVKKNNVNNVNNTNNIVDKRGKAVSEVLLYSNGDVRIHGILADNSKYGYIIKKNNELTSSGSSSTSRASYIGLQLNNKYWVKNVKKDKYLISYGKGFDIDEKWINIEELKKLLKKP